MKRRPQRFPVAPPLTDSQANVVARFDAAPPAPESFVHLSTCEGTPDAPGLCDCPAAFVTIGAPR